MEFNPGPAFVVAGSADQGAEEDMRLREAQIRELGESGDVRLVETMRTLLCDQEWRIRRAAAEALGSLQDRRAVPALSAALGDPYSGVRAAAATALGILEDPRSVGFLVPLLSDVFISVRVATALAVTKLGDFRGMELLYADPVKTELSVRIAVVEALGRVPGTRAFDALCDRLRGSASPADPLADLLTFPESARIRREHTTRELPIRLAAAAALGVQGDERAVGLLHSHLSDPGAELRRAAADSLRTLGWKPESDADQALVAIAEMQWDASALARPGALGPLCARLEDPVHSIRLKAIEAIETLNSRAALPALRSRLRRFGVRETNSAVRERLVQAIRSIDRSTEQLRDLPLASSGPEPDARTLPIPAATGAEEP